MLSEAPTNATAASVTSNRTPAAAASKAKTIPVNAEQVASAIRDPIAVIQRLFEQAVAAKVPELPTASDTFGIPEYFESLLSDPAALAMVPSLMDSSSLTAANDASLIRFRCMIQDNGYQPEVYVPFARNLASGTLSCFKFHEHKPAEGSPLDLSNPVFADKSVFYAVGVPAESQWSKELRKGLSTSNDNGDEDLAAKLRDGLSLTAAPQDPAVAENFRKRPLPWEDTIGAVIKCYHTPSTTEFRLNEALEVVGILEKSSSASCTIHGLLFHRLDLSDHPEFQGTKVVANNANFACPMERNHDTFLEAIRMHAPNLEASALSQYTVTEIRTELIRWIADSALQGDRLVAEYLLLWLVARVYNRSPELTLGNLSLTISRCPQETAMDDGTISQPHPLTLPCSNLFSKNLFHLVQALTPKSLLIPLTVETLNQQKFVPKSAAHEDQGDFSMADSGASYEKGTVESGLLQLADGTYLLLDETSLNAGQLNSNGFHNLAALGHLLASNSLPYQFGNQSITFDKNLHVLVLQEGDRGISTNVKTSSEQSVRTSLLPTDITIPLTPATSGYSAAVVADIAHPWLPLFRMYIALFRSAGRHSHDYTIPEAMAKSIEQEFAAQRKCASESGGKEKLMTDMDLLQLLGLARLLALSWGRSELDESIWNRVKLMEKTRSDRLKKSEASSSAAVQQPGH